MKNILFAFAAAAALSGAPSFAATPAAAPAVAPAVASIAAPVPAPAAAAKVDPQTTAAVQQMLEAMEVRKMMGAAFAEMQKSLPGMLRSQFTAAINADATLSAERKKEMLAKAEASLPAAVETINRVFADPAVLDEMMAGMVPLYANNYTTAEVKELTRFYATPVGRKMLALTPRLSAESMALSQRIVTPRLTALMQEFMQATQGK